MSRHRSARVVPLGAAALALMVTAPVVLAGCGTPMSTSPATSASSPVAASGRASLDGAAAHGPASNGSNPAVPAGSIPFPAAVGNTWVYDVVTSTDNTHAIDTRKVLSLHRITGGTRVTMSDTLSPGGGTAIENYIFYDNGQLGFPVNVPHGIAVVSGNGVVWPDAAGLDSGRAYHSVLKIRLPSGRYETANVTVQGDGTVPVSVPGGKYQTTLVTMIITAKVGRFDTTAVVKVWVAPGTGPVKSGETIVAGGNTESVSTSELLSFTRGGGRQDGS